MFKKRLMLIVVLGVVLLLSACGNQLDGAETSEEPVESDGAETSEESVESDGAEVSQLELPVVSIYMEGYGEIIAELYPEYAPITVDNFLNLVEEGFYDGLTFHRIIDGFMMQGGCPYGQGFGGSGTMITGEFADNGVENPLTHTRGVLSMARSAEYDSASSQFFIMHGNSPHLDGGYAAFGRVTSGMDVVDAIVESVEPLDGDGAVAEDEQPIIREIRLINGS